MPDIHNHQHITLVNQIETLLPQTQCTKCKTPGCRPYAEEIAAGAPINRCVPGGAATIAELAALLDRPALPLDPDYGSEPTTRRVAFIREDECIGCTKCIQACPVDAIVGAAKLMHTVITDECTGCDLCIPPCPVDCIDIHDLPKVTDPVKKHAIATHNRLRFEARNARLANMTSAPVGPTTDPAARAVLTLTPTTPAKPEGASAVIAAALARSNLKKAERKLAAARESSADTGLILEEIQRLQEELKTLM